MTYVRNKKAAQSDMMSKRDLARNGGYSVVPSHGGFLIIGPRDKFLKRRSKDTVYISENTAWDTAYHRLMRTQRERRKTK